ncbi:CBS domain-containing protein [Archangium violaceum]|uniref:CBS domain-containing protein n=1 Tax=Archangium violaceum TaxID=83451 RepID=UPI001EF0B539|nr:CBS domain-containing protein [Archangium violaceum]
MTHVVDDFMTRGVHTIGTQSPLSDAHRLMNEHAIRHLPVLEGGKLVGVVSMRDLHLIETLKGVDPKEVAVEEAMSQDAYTVPPGTTLLEVARTMAMHKYGSAVIASKGRVEGIFTTVDALKALETLLATPQAEATPSPRRKTTPRQLGKKGARTTAKRPTAKSASKRPSRKAAPARKRGGG